MSTGAGEALAAQYMADLEREAQALPPDRRSDLLGDITEHLAAAREQGAEDEAGMKAVLERLGAPRDIVAAERDDRPRPVIVQAVPGTGRELAAVLLLSIGSIVVPVIGWLIGVALLWASPLWRREEKLLGTLVWPGGGFAALLALTFPARTCSGSTVGRVDGRVFNSVEVCSGPAVPLWLGIPGMLVLLVAPVVVAVLLYRRAKQRAADAAARQAQELAGWS